MYYANPMILCHTHAYTNNHSDARRWGEQKKKTKNYWNTNVFTQFTFYYDWINDFFPSIFLWRAFFYSLLIITMLGIRWIEWATCATTTFLIHVKQFIRNFFHIFLLFIARIIRNFCAYRRVFFSSSLNRWFYCRFLLLFKSINLYLASTSIFSSINLSNNIFFTIECLKFCNDIVRFHDLWFR